MRLHSDSLPPSGSSALKSPSYSRVEAVLPSGQKNSSGNKVENGTGQPQKVNNESPPKLENGIGRNKDDINDDGE